MGDSQGNFGHVSVAYVLDVEEKKELKTTEAHRGARTAPFETTCVHQWINE